MIEPTNLDCLSEIPVSINGNYGDSLQPSQWQDTLSKLKSLKKSGHKANIMVPTKYVMNSEQMNIIKTEFPDVWIFFAITGLNESKLFSTEDYLRSYEKLCENLNNVVCSIRPIVKGMNDNMSTLLPILERVSKGFVA